MRGKAGTPEFHSPVQGEAGGSRPPSPERTSTLLVSQTREWQGTNKPGSAQRSHCEPARQSVLPAVAHGTQYMKVTGLLVYVTPSSIYCQHSDRHSGHRALPILASWRQVSRETFSLQVNFISGPLLVFGRWGCSPSKVSWVLAACAPELVRLGRHVVCWDADTRAPEILACAAVRFGAVFHLIVSSGNVIIDECAPSARNFPRLVDLHPFDAKSHIGPSGGYDAIEGIPASFRYIPLHGPCGVPLHFNSRGNAPSRVIWRGFF